MKDEGELVQVWKTTYSVIVRGDGIKRCAWCEKPLEEIDDFNAHANKHVEDKNAAQ